MKNKIAKLIDGEVELGFSEVENLIEIPPEKDMGDFAFPCFSLAKTLKKSPVQIAKDLVMKFKKDLSEGISEVKNDGAYVNFFVDRVEFVSRVLESEFCEVERNRKKVVIDMSSPNIAKPFGIGHLRSTIIGNSLARICEANGFEVVKINYLGDWGTQFGKIILAWKKWGNEKELKRDAVGHLYELYVRGNAEEFEEEARVEFKKLENGDKENLELWKRFRELSLKDFDKIYDLLGIKFDMISGESLYNDKMNGVVEKLESKGLLKVDDGAKVVDLSDEGLGVVLIQKSDGTSLYATRDIAMVIDRKKIYDFDKGIYEVGVEQKLHFRQVFGVLRKMGYSWSKDLVHVAHGLYLDKDGKKFSTRQGKSVFMKDVLDEVVSKARDNLIKRGIFEKDLEERARKIAISAIFYGDLKNNRERNMVFDVDKFLEFEGDTGPYLLYSYARASSLLKKVSRKNKGFYVDELKDVEYLLVRKIFEFEDVVRRAYEGLAPNLVAKYCFDLASLFNEFYHACPVLGGKTEGVRLKIVEVFRDRMGKGLDLLGIGKLEEM